MQSLINKLFPQLNGKWRRIELDKYAKVLKEDVNLSSMAWRDSNPFLDPVVFGEWVNLLHRTLGVDYSWGGYMEDREEILDGTYLPAGGKVHLGIDFWVPEGTVVHLPKTGRLVQSRYDSDQNGGWGGQAIFDIGNLFLIFGHLRDVVDEIGLQYSEGWDVGAVAGIDGSGGWYPHLHLQCMTRFDIDVDGYSKFYEGIGSDFPYPGDIV